MCLYVANLYSSKTISGDCRDSIRYLEIKSDFGALTPSDSNLNFKSKILDSPFSLYGTNSSPLISWLVSCYSYSFNFSIGTTSFSCFRSTSFYFALCGFLLPALISRFTVSFGRYAAFGFGFKSAASNYASSRATSCM